MSVGESQKRQPPLVLYAEDNRLVAAPVRDVLELAGRRVEHCADGVTALALLQSARLRRVRYDLVLLDNELPQMAGMKVARAARGIKECSRTPIILVALEDCADEARGRRERVHAQAAQSRDARRLGQATAQEP